MTEQQPFQLVVKRHTRRKSVAIYIVDAETVEVRAPEWVSHAYIQTLLDKKHDWIIKQLRQQAPRLNLKAGSQILLNGEKVVIAWTPSGKTVLADNVLHINASDESQAKVAALRWLKNTARKHLEDRFDYWVSATGLMPESLSIRTFRSRWGSCDSRGQIKLNWRLIHAPVAVQDYVIIHELCHLQEMNHSPHFWRSVEQFDPRYKHHRRWLKDNGNQLMAVG